MNILSRDSTLPEDRWNVEALYPDSASWQKDFLAFAPTNQTPQWPALAALQGTLAQSPKKLREALDLVMQYDRQLTKLYTYAHLRHDEDITQTECKECYDRITRSAHQFAEETSWFQPELLSLSTEKFEEFLKSQDLEPYKFHLEKILRLKKHTLAADKEQLLALAGQALETSHKAFRAMNDADFKFGIITNSKGEEKLITHGTYGMYIRDSDRSFREKAFKKYHGQFSAYENSLAELLNGQVQNHLFNARARSFDSCLDAALYPKNIDTSIYRSLIQAVNDNLSAHHQYMDLRKKILGVDQLHLYDIYVPLIQNVDIKMDYSEAEDMIIDSVAPLGSEYLDKLKTGLKSQRWVDRYENQNKRSGAYSSGCYDSMPYILMNYKGVIRDVFTLAHEAGHSMHSLYSRRSQPYQYGDYPIFLAEVASTFNEDLLTRLLLKNCKDPQTRIYLINQKIEDIRTTLFRQTMFAEFELFIHEQAEKGTPLTPQMLKLQYRELNRKYFGPNVVIDDEIDIEWARIPHFYYNFYVFQYATGISAALALSDRVVNGGDKERQQYLNFLKSGSSRYPLETLKLAGIDMSSPAPVKAAIDTFGRLVQELNTLVGG